MTSAKITDAKDLKKMNKQDRLKLQKETVRALASQKLRVKTKEDKQSHKVKLYKNQLARIQTFNNQSSDEE